MENIKSVKLCEKERKIITKKSCSHNYCPKQTQYTIHSNWVSIIFAVDSYHILKHIYQNQSYEIEATLTFSTIKMRTAYPHTGGENKINGHSKINGVFGNWNFDYDRASKCKTLH